VRTQSFQQYTECVYFTECVLADFPVHYVLMDVDIPVLVLGRCVADKIGAPNTNFLSLLESHTYRATLACGRAPFPWRRTIA
jgi:hypothetical protein